MPNSYNYSENYDKYAHRLDDSPLSKMRQQYWSAKQNIRCKLKRKEDEYLLASDAELDAKLLAFDSIKSTCENLLRCIERYQDYLCDLAHEENALGRFLKNNGKADKTQAGKIMAAVGRAQSYTAQQRLSLRIPLIRLYHELEVFVERAIVDCSRTVEKMEEARTDYRGSLLWMKNATQQLDPDTFRQMEKFRTIQSQVKRNKAKFDKLKLDCLQKIDLLSASRCNLFSQILAVYQNSLMSFWDKTVKTYNVITDSFKGYQYFEFKILKTLTDPSLKPAEAQKADEKPLDKEQENELISLALSSEKPISRTESMENFFNDSPDNDKISDIDHLKDVFGNAQKSDNEATVDRSYTEISQLLEQSQNDMHGFLDDNIDSSDTSNEPQSFASQWENAFGIENSTDLGANVEPSVGSSAFQEQTFSSFFDQPGNKLLPSDLLDLKLSSSTLITPSAFQKESAADSAGIDKQALTKQKEKPTWFDLFSDVDPLQNPDSFGKSFGSSDGC